MLLTYTELIERKLVLEETLLDKILDIEPDEFQALVKEIDTINDQLETLEPEIPFIF